MNMVSLLACKLLAISAVVSLTFALKLPPRPSVPLVPAIDGPVVDRNGSTIPPYNTTYEFDQLIDHTNPKLGTFKQRYWHTWEFYEPGGPIVLFTPGEANAQPYTGYLTNRTINGQIAQQENAAAIVLEHRYYGLSNPYPDLTVKSLKFHTIQQAIDDLEYFAKNVKLAMPGGDNVAPGKAPWVLVGGSYSGALTSWTMVNKRGLFQAGYASSAVVEAILDYWGYFEPIRQFMPKNCSADVQAVITHIDSVFSGKDRNQINQILTAFGLQDLAPHLDDAAGALRNNLWDWQGLSPSSGPGAQFFNFCDALEVKDGVSAPAAGWGLAHALQAWSSYWRSTYLSSLCGNSTVVDCLGSYDPHAEFYTSTDIDNAGRSWTWIVCNEVGYFQDGAPLGHPSLVTRLVQPAYDERTCQLFFPQAFPRPPIPNVEKTNAAYDGWNVQIERIFFANGQRDPWREATLSADGQNFQSTPQQPIAAGDGFHCSDLSTANGNVDSTVRAVQVQALASIKSWIAEWTPAKASRDLSETADTPVPAFRFARNLQG